MRKTLPDLFSKMKYGRHDGNWPMVGSYETPSGRQYIENGISDRSQRLVGSSLRRNSNESTRSTGLGIGFPIPSHPSSHAMDSRPLATDLVHPSSSIWVAQCKRRTAKSFWHFHVSRHANPESEWTHRSTYTAFSSWSSGGRLAAKNPPTPQTRSRSLWTM